MFNINHTIPLFKGPGEVKTQIIYNTTPTIKFSESQFWGPTPLPPPYFASLLLTPNLAKTIFETISGLLVKLRRFEGWVLLSRISPPPMLVARVAANRISGHILYV